MNMYFYSGYKITDTLSYDTMNKYYQSLLIPDWDTFAAIDIALFLLTYLFRFSCDFFIKIVSLETANDALFHQ